jgi:hypothetical protein
MGTRIVGGKGGDKKPDEEGKEETIRGETRAYL